MTQSQGQKAALTVLAVGAFANTKPELALTLDSSIYVRGINKSNGDFGSFIL